MALQKGPGEGYMAAKDLVLAKMPDAVCRRVEGPGGLTGYIIYRNKDHADRRVHPLVSAGSARDAWNKVLFRLQDAQHQILRSNDETSPRTSD